AATMTTKGDLITHDTSTFARLAVGTNAHVLKADSSASTGLAWGQIATASIADDAVTAAKISAGAVAASELASDAVTTAKILDANVTAGKLATDSVTTAKIADSNVTTAKIADSAITEAKLGLTELKVRRTTSTTLTYNNGYSVVWNVEDADASSFISVSSSNITVPTGKAGLYSVGYTLTFDYPGDDYLIDVYLYLGGAYVRPNNYTTSFQPDANKVYSGATVYLDASSLIYLDVTNKSVNQASLTMTSARLWLTRIMD
ncbi:MAG: hypothetical protein EBU84_21955, partial [Actinobacteria bacterium]|nr:hypothetical protein [Actinomycetota bacterium]